MARNIFEREVGEFLRAHFPVAERVDDAAFNRGGGYQVRQKPWDFYGMTGMGYFWCAEAKSVKSPRFPFKNLALHQKSALKTATLSGGMVWLFINWRTSLLDGKDKTGAAIWIDAWRFALLEQTREAQGRMSLKPVDVDEAWFLRRVVGGWEVPETHSFYGCYHA